MLFLNKGILNYNSSNYLSILQDGNTVGWWIADDLTTIARRIVDTTVNEAAIYNYLKAKYGL
jgi:hypothetical protein